MASNEKVRVQRLYKNAATYLSANGIKAGHRTRVVLVQLIEKFTGNPCEVDPNLYVENFVQSQKRLAMASAKQPWPFKPYRLPLDMRLAAKKVVNEPVPVSMSSSVVYKYFP